MTELEFRSGMIKYSVIIPLTVNNYTNM